MSPIALSATLDAYEEEFGAADLAECGRALRQHVNRLTHLMTELLDYGKPAAIQPEPEASAMPEPAPEPELAAVSVTTPEPEPAAMPEPTPEPVEDVLPVLEPVAAVETAPAPEPAPELEALFAARPQQSAFSVVVRLRDGDGVEVGSFRDFGTAMEGAQEVIEQFSTATDGQWPFYAGRFIRPDLIVSVDVVEGERF